MLKDKFRKRKLLTLREKVNRNLQAQHKMT